MLLFRIAISLEIIGFLFASIFGLIFLNRDVVGNIANKLDAKVTNISSIVGKRLERRTRTIFKLSTLVAENKAIEGMIGGIGSRFFALIIIIIGLIWGISWVFWLGIAWASLYVLLTMFTVFARVLYLSKKNESWLYLLLYPLLLCWALLLGFVIAPVILNVYLILLYGALIITLVVSVLMISDNLKKLLIVMGSVLVAIGLILEAVAMW